MAQSEARKRLAAGDVPEDLRPILRLFVVEVKQTVDYFEEREAAVLRAIETVSSEVDLLRRELAEAEARLRRAPELLDQKVGRIRSHAGKLGEVVAQAILDPWQDDTEPAYLTLGDTPTQDL